MEQGAHHHGSETPVWEHAAPERDHCDRWTGPGCKTWAHRKGSLPEHLVEGSRRRTIMPRSLRWRLVLSYSGIALLAAVCLGVVLLITLRSYYLQREQAYLVDNA